VPTRGRFSNDPETRQLVEEYAMERARQFFSEQGFVVKTHDKPFNLRCTRDEAALFVEVKGTQTDGEEILLTPNEVAFASRHKDRMALFVVSNIVVSADAHGKRMASGGTKHIENPWR
jgi:hypothetical protein